MRANTSVMPTTWNRQEITEERMTLDNSLKLAKRQMLRYSFKYANRRIQSSA